MAPPEEGEVVVVRLAAEPPPALFAYFHTALTEDEQGRARRFRFAADRARYVVGRGGLRRMLAAPLQVDPRGIGLEEGPWGKPRVVSPPAPTLPQVNVSHSGDWVVLAWARDAEVGVDVEAVRDGVAYQEVAEAVFAPAERAVLARLDGLEQRDAFFRCWARKEAFIKAVGEGVSFGLDRFVVSLAPGEPAALRWVDPEKARGPYRLYDLEMGEAHAGAVAVRAEAATLRCVEWHPEPGASDARR